MCASVSLHQLLVLLLCLQPWQPCSCPVPLSMGLHCQHSPGQMRAHAEVRKCLDTQCSGCKPPWSEYGVWVQCDPDSGLTLSGPWLRRRKAGAAFTSVRGASGSLPGAVSARGVLGEHPDRHTGSTLCQTQGFVLVLQARGWRWGPTAACPFLRSAALPDAIADGSDWGWLECCSGELRCPDQRPVGLGPRRLSNAVAGRHYGRGPSCSTRSPLWR